MKKTAGVVVLLLVFALATNAQVVPPINLSGELLAGGQVALTWDPPPDGLVEDFEDGEAQGFEWWVPSGSWVIEDGYAKLTTVDDWGSAAYMDVTFEGDYTAEITFEYQTGDLSRGILFNGDGPRDADYNGYGFWIAHTLDGYAVWKYTNGSGTAEIYWVSAPNLINEGPGAVNTLKIENNANGPVDLYVNGTYVNSIANPTYTSGTVGLVSASSNQVWFEEITSVFGIATQAPQGQPFAGNPVEGFYNEFGLPVDQMPPLSADQPAVNQITTPADREIDEFIEYRVYMDDEFIGTSDDESYTAQLAGLGEHEFYVTALYDEGESGPSNTVTISWDAALLDLTGTTTIVPETGGPVMYAVDFLFTLNMTVPGVSYWTEVTLPNGQVFGPLNVVPFTVTPFMDVSVQNVTQNIPGLAPAGVYTLTGHVGFMPNSQISDSFEFEKLGAVGAATQIPFRPEQWTVSNFRPTVK